MRYAAEVVLGQANILVVLDRHRVLAPVKQQVLRRVRVYIQTPTNTHTHTHTRLTALCPGLPG